MKLLIKIIIILYEMDKWHAPKRLYNKGGLGLRSHLFAPECWMDVIMVILFFIFEMVLSLVSRICYYHIGGDLKFSIGATHSTC
jgi:hypothetical protein